jgi:hypothetical protein
MIGRYSSTMVSKTVWATLAGEERKNSSDHRENVVHGSPDELPKEGPLWYGEPLREVQESLAGFPVERYSGLDKGLTCFSLRTTGQPPA